jgi:mono/diheme cytochrome c family protein
VVTAIAVATASVIPLLAARPAFAQSTKTVWDGVFTTGQAARGEGSYQKACSSCHGASLEGDAFAPPLVGEPFTGRWQDGTVGDVLLVVKTTMPEDRPATLGADVYADIVAFLLKMNSYPAGQSELGQDPAQLKDTRITKAPSRGL